MTSSIDEPDDAKADTALESMRVDAELRVATDLHRELVENAQDIIFTHDLNGNFTSVNRAAEVMTGYSRDELLALRPKQLIAPEDVDRARNMLERRMRGEPETAYELTLITKNGEKIVVEVNSRLIVSNGVPIGVQGIARNVTARKQDEEQTRDAMKMEAVGLLAGGIAHDFNNLLTVMLGYTDILSRKLERDEQLKVALHEIQSAAERARSLTRELLAFSRKQLLHPTVVDLNVFLAEAECMLGRLVGDDVELRTVLGPDVGPVFVDPNQLEQVVVNLSVNARDAMPDGGVLTIRTNNVELDESTANQWSGLEPGSYVQLAVEDTGAVMTPEAVKRVFEPFFTTRELGRGAGLGLSAAQGFIRQSGGSISVVSEIGVGTTFKVVLPRVAAPLPETTDAADSEVPSRGSETILVVEDDALLRKLVRQILEDRGYSVLVAANGRVALREFQDKAGHIDLVLSDVVMPEVDGRELRNQLRAIRPDLRILFMSGYNSDVIDAHDGQLDGSSLLLKPFTPDALARAVRERLDE